MILCDEARWSKEDDVERFNYIMYSDGLYTLTDQNHRSTRLTSDELRAILKGITPAYKFKVSNPKTIKRGDRHWLCQPFEVRLIDLQEKNPCTHIKFISSNSKKEDELFLPHDFLIGFLSGANEYRHLKSSFDHFGFKTTDRSENYPHVILALLCPHLIYRR